LRWTSQEEEDVDQELGEEDEEIYPSIIIPTKPRCILNVDMVHCEIHGGDAQYYLIPNGRNIMMFHQQIMIHTNEKEDVDHAVYGPAI
jgi:hypothetical protein